MRFTPHRLRGSVIAPFYHFNAPVAQIMSKPIATSIRLPEDIKDALEIAAADDRRTQSSMIEKILADWLKANGYLKAKAKAR